jgi:hypothetical protein
VTKSALQCLTERLNSAPPTGIALSKLPSSVPSPYFTNFCSY